MKYDTIVFDLDGTLLDTLEDLADSVNFIMAKYGYEKKTINQVRQYVGNGASQLISRCLPDGSNNSLFYEILNDYKRYYNENCLNKTKPYTGIIEMLRQLSSKKIKMSIVSNKPDPAVKILNDIYFKRFICTALGEREQLNKKPAPDLVFDALLRTGGNKEYSVYVGDSEVDIHTAKNAGLDCICVSWGFRGEEALRAAGAETVIKAPSELLDYII